MSTMNGSSLAVLGAFVLVSSLAIAGSAKAADGQPTTHMQAAAADEQAVLADIVRAEINLDRGRGTVNQVEKAETILLNAQQSGAYRASKTLAALEQARSDIGTRNAKAEVKDLQAAEAALRTPTHG
jgi:hypothetical protein